MGILLKAIGMTDVDKVIRVILNPPPAFMLMPSDSKETKSSFQTKKMGSGSPQNENAPCHTTKPTTVQVTQIPLPLNKHPHIQSIKAQECSPKDTEDLCQNPGARHHRYTPR